MLAELVIRYCGLGYNCSNCGRNRETTRYTLLLDKVPQQEFRLCDECQTKGYVIKFTPKRPPVHMPRERRRRVKLSQRLEEGLAADIRGRTLPGSGNRDYKGDVRVMDRWRLEHKFTESVTSYTLKVGDLAAVIRHANLMREWPGLVITFQKLGRKFVVVPYEVFLELAERDFDGTDQHSTPAQHPQGGSTSRKRRGPYRIFLRGHECKFSLPPRIVQTG